MSSSPHGEEEGFHQPRSPRRLSTIWVAAFKYTMVYSAAILNQTNTVFMVLFATWLLKEPFTHRHLIGMALAFTGAAMAS